MFALLFSAGLFVYLMLLLWWLLFVWFTCFEVWLFCVLVCQGVVLCWDFGLLLGFGLGCWFCVVEVALLCCDCLFVGLRLFRFIACASCVVGMLVYGGWLVMCFVSMSFAFVVLG